MLIGCQYCNQTYNRLEDVYLYYGVVYASFKIYRFKCPFHEKTSSVKLLESCLIMCMDIRACKIYDKMSDVHTVISDTSG